MGNHQGNKNSSLPNNWKYESTRQRGKLQSCSSSLQHTLHISLRALRTSCSGRRLKRTRMKNTLNVEKNIKRHFLDKENVSANTKNVNEHCSQIPDFTSGCKIQCTHFVLSGRSHSTERQTFNLVKDTATTEDARNSLMEQDLSSELSEYDNELYTDNWTIGDCSDNSQEENDCQSNFKTSLAELGLPIKNVMVKGQFWDCESSTKAAQLDSIIQQNRIVSSDLISDHLVSPEHTSNLGGPKDLNSKLNVSQIQAINLSTDAGITAWGYVLNQSFQRAPKAGRLDDRKIRLDAVLTQDLQAPSKEPMLVCQHNPMVLTQNRVQIKSGRKTKSSFYSPSSSGSLENVLSLGTQCSVGLFTPMVHHYILPLPKEETDEGNGLHSIRGESSLVDAGSLSGSVSALDLSLNESNASWTLPAFQAMILSLPVGENQDERVSHCKSVSQDSSGNSTDFLRIAPAGHDISNPLTRPELELTSSESEERTPGRLQAIWPPPKPKDEEEKIGLKYTEAEHQAALLQLKRECKEEVETIEADFKLQLFRLREENTESVSKLQGAIAELKEKAKHSHRDLRDVAVSTEDNSTPRTFRTVCIQTDRETFIKPVEDAESSSALSPQPNVPKKLDITSINLSLSGKKHVAKQEQPPLLDQPPPPPPPLPVPDQSESANNIAPPPPPSLQGPNDNNKPFPPPPPFSAQSESANNIALPPPPSLPGPSDNNGLPPPPPPPPITGSGLPPPPPAPSSTFSPSTGAGWLPSRAEGWAQRKQRVEPVCPMKPLYWTRIQIQNNRNDTLWSSLKEPAIINTNEFAELFAKMSTPAKRKPLSEAYEKKVKAKKIIKVLDGKRSQAVGILISSLHLDMKDIQQAVLMLDNSVVDLDAIEALYENRAQPEELERIRKHYETSDEEHIKMLDKPEQFLYELSQIPEFSLRAHCIILQSTFADTIASIKHKTEIVLRVCQELLGDSVREVLGLVLALGNYMNGGSRTRGQADGFDLDILPKLKDVKSKDNHISLLDYVVSYYLHNYDENAGTEDCVCPLPEPQDVFLAAQMKFEDLNRELRKLRRDLADCEKDVQTVCSKSSQEYIHPFKEKMEAFIANAQNEHITTDHHLLLSLKSFHDLIGYFGLKPRSGEKDVLPGHVFMLWYEFCNDFKTRWKRENKAISKERLKEAQQSVRNITAEKKVETRRVHANGLKERLRQKEASLSTT